MLGWAARIPIGILAVLVPVAVVAADGGGESPDGGRGARAAAAGDGETTGPVVPRVAWGVDDFAGPAYEDWLLGDPFRLVPRPRGPVPPRYPRGVPLEGGFPGRRILLTFDDGPFPDSTPRLLDILAREHVHAVFFLVGGRVAETARRRQGRRIVQRILAGGNVVGNHSYNHPRLPELAEGAWKQQILDTHEAIRSAAGDPPTLFRPPYGKTNGAIDRYLTYRGYTRVQWTFVADEFRGRPADVMARGVLEQIRERERSGRNVGGILLLHDSHPHSVDCAELFIRRMKAENCALLDAGDDDVWRFVDVGEFFQPVGGAAPDPQAAPPHATADQIAEARRWCDEHRDELDQIRSLDTLQVDINEDGFGRPDGYQPIDDPPTPY